MNKNRSRARRMLSLFVAAAMVMTLWAAVPLTASAETADGFEYTVEDGNAIIIGYTGSETDLVIPDTLGNCPVTQIGVSAFVSNNSLVSVTFPESIQYINMVAFATCTSLKSVTIPNGDIGRQAFRACSSLESVTIGEGVTTIGLGAFQECSSLSSVIIGEGVTNIGSWAFAFCTSLTTVDIPNSVTTIGDVMFRDCTSLTSVTIPNSVKTIGGGVFSGCTSLTAINVGDNNTAYTSVGGALYNKAKTQIIQFPAGKSGDYEIPDGVESISTAFNGSCGEVRTLTIPRSVTSIDADAFTGRGFLTIRCYRESYAHRYAFGNSIPFTLIDGDDGDGGSGDIAIDAVSLDKTALSLDAGSTAALTLGYTPDSATETPAVIWMSSDQSIATVVGGTVTAKSAGSAVITALVFAKGGTKTATCIVTVRGGQPSVQNPAPPTSTGTDTSETAPPASAPTVQPQTAPQAAETIDEPNLPKLATPKLKVGSKQIKVTWKEPKAADDADGYEIGYRISGKKWSVKKADGDDLSITIKKLKAGKKYDVRIRAYVKHDSKTFYSPWSNTARSAKVKK